MATRKKIDDPSRSVFVNTLRAFEGREVCTGEPLVNGTSKHLEFSFHPNEEGQAVLATVP